MNEKQIVTTIARELGVRPAQVAATAELLDEANTIPFIARYRQEATGSLDESQLRAVSERLAQMRALEERRAAVLARIEALCQLAPGLREQITYATVVTTLDDHYQPYRPNSRNRAI